MYICLTNSSLNATSCHSQTPEQQGHLVQLKLTCFIKQPRALIYCDSTRKIRKRLGTSRPQFSTQNFVYCSALGAYVHQLGPWPKPLPAAREWSVLWSVLWSCPSCALLVTGTAAPAFPSPHRGKEIHVNQLQGLTGHHKSFNVYRYSSFHVTPSHVCSIYTILPQICSPFTLQAITLLFLVAKPYFLPPCYNSQDLWVGVQINPQSGSNKI